MNSRLKFSRAQNRRYFMSRLPGQLIKDRVQVNVRCPFHDDRKASLSLNLDEGIWCCHGPCNVGGGLLDFEQKLMGCDKQTAWDAIYEAIGIAKRVQRSVERADPETVHRYLDAKKNLLFQLIRRPGKKFSVRRPDGHGGWVLNIDGVVPVLYNLPRVKKAEVVLIAEGEMDCDTLTMQLGLTHPELTDGIRYAATTNPFGAGRWKPEFSKCLARKRVYLFFDNDQAGQKHAIDVLRSVHPFATSIALVELPGLGPGGDVSDWLREHTADELWARIKTAKKWCPEDGTPPSLEVDSYDLGLVSMADLLAKPAAPTDWLWKNRLPTGTVNLLVSKPKVGKSTSARNLAIAVARGGKLFELPVKKGRVVYLHLEETADHVLQDFRAMGADPSVDIEFGDHATMESVLQILKAKRPALLVVDPLFRLIHVRDEKNYAEIYQALGPLIDAARKYGTCILCLHHSSKSIKSDAIDSPIGSTALGGIPSTLLVMKATDRYRTLQTVQRSGPCMEETVLDFDPVTKQLSLGASIDEVGVLDTETAILACLERGSLTEPEINQAVEGKTTYKRRALRELLKRRRIKRSGCGKRGDPYRYRTLRTR